MFKHKRFQDYYSLLLGRYGLSVLPSSLQSAIYSCNWPHNQSFLESMQTNWSTVTLAYNTQQITKFLPYSPSGAVSYTLRIYYTSPPCNLWLLWPVVFGAIELASITNSKLRGRTFVRAHVQSSHVYLTSILDVTHMIKCTRLSPSLVERAWERG